MKITLLPDQRTLRLSFRFHAATVSFAKSLVGSEYDKRSKDWLVPLCHLRTIMERFPTATVEDLATVIEARYELWRQWIRNHNSMGFYFAFSPADAATVVAYRDDAEPVSDVLQAHVAKRSPQLREWLHVQIFPSAPTMPRPHRPSVWDTAEPTDGEALIMRGIQNAAEREDRRAEVVERVRVKGKRRRSKAVQAELLTEESG